MRQGKLAPPPSADRPGDHGSTPWRRRPLTPQGVSAPGSAQARLSAPRAGGSAVLEAISEAAEQAGEAGEGPRPGSAGTSEGAAAAGCRDDGPAERAAEEESGGQQAGSQQPDGSAAADEEEEMSLSSSSSESESDGEAGGGSESPGARARARQEARELLRDARPAGRRTDFFEEEAEMSEDEGHSDDGSDAGGEDEHDRLLDDLIGHERERRRDERLRAAAHAEWQERQDEADVQAVLAGIRNGFRRRKGDDLFDEDGGSLAAARRRRAALQDGAGSDSDSSDDESDGGRPAGGLVEIEEGLSDDEAKAGLKRYQESKLLAESEDQEPVALALVDAESQALLDSLAAQANQRRAPVEPPRSQFGFSPGEVRRGSVKASFLGKAAPAANLSRAGSQQNTRSYIFGSHSNAAPEPAEAALAALEEPAPVAVGHKRAAPKARPAPAPSRASLLEMLEPGQAAATKTGGDGPTAFDISAIMGKRQKAMPRPGRR